MTDSNVLRVARHQLKVEDPWETPENGQAVSLSDSTGGSLPRLETKVYCFQDEHSLSVLFAGEDDSVTASYREHDDPLYEEDVLEIFLAPETLTTYWEIEVNPLGAIFDARVSSPYGTRGAMSVDRGWTCEGLQAFQKRDRNLSEGTWRFSTLISIPFRSLSVPVPAPGDRWRANFFRIDRHPSGDEFTAWQATARKPPDFHVPAAFGYLLF